MDMEAALLGRLRADEGVAAIVGARSYWVERPQTTALPALTLQTISAPRSQHMGGVMQTQQATVQIDAWAASYGQARALREAVIAALVPAATLGGVRFGRSFVAAREGGAQGSADFIHRQIMDFRITWSPA